MTSSLGIAATTAVLRRLLQDAIPAAQLFGVLGAVDVTALPPDRIDVTAEKSSLNLFMYQVRPNLGWINAEMPSHDAAGRRRGNPPLALDLSYMLSAYGARNFHGEILLGYGALVLHQTRVLLRDAVKATFAGGGLPPDLALLATSGLDGQEELVKLTMDPLSTDELSRLWSVFGEKYRPSIPFEATVVLLRATSAVVPPGPPVQQARLATTTSINPTITAVEPAMVTAGAGVSVELVGTSLLTADTDAKFSSGDSAPAAAGSTPMRVRVPLPAGLRAGVNTVVVQHAVRFESDVRRGVESNVAPFMLRPAFALTGAGNPDIVVGGRTTTGQTTSATITVKVVPPVGKRQSVSLLLDQTGAPAGTAPRGYAVPAPSREAGLDETDTIAFAVTSVLLGRYVVRVRVDGAETELQQTGEVYDQPQVDLT